MRCGMAVFVLCFAAGVAVAELIQTDANTWKDDFEGANLKGWTAPPEFALDRDGANGVLRAGGPTQEEQAKCRIRTATADPEIEDGAVECSIRKMAGNWAGVTFRAGRSGVLEVFFDEHGRLMLRRHPGSKVIAALAVPASDQPYRRLRIEGTGPKVRVLVDGQVVKEIEDAELLKGKCGVVAHFVFAYFDDFVVTTAPVAK